MPFTMTLTVQKVGGGSKDTPLTDNEIPDAKMDKVVEFAWDDKATDADRKPIDEDDPDRGPGDDLNLDLEIFGRVVRAAVHGWFASRAGRKARQVSEPLE